MTDWEKQLRKRATAVTRADQARDDDIAAARLDGHSFREIGRWAGVNHESARGVAIRINGNSLTRDPYFTTTGSDFFHATADCAGWRRGRNAGDGSNPVIPLTAEQAEAATQKPCPECVPTGRENKES
jgi:hypothetical protein